MFRKMIVALSVTAGALGTAGIESKAEAADPRINVSFGGPGWSFGYNNMGYRGPYYPGYYPSYYLPAVNHYDVFYRTCPAEPWRLYGSYQSHSFAHEIVDRLEWRGYQARMTHY